MSTEVWAYSIISVILVSMVSLIGVVTLSLNDVLLRKILLFLVSFAAGGLFGGAFFHLVPEALDHSEAITVSVYVMLGIMAFFILEKFIHWRHCHVPTSKAHPHPLGMMNLIGDGFHNLIDGLVIGASYLASIPLGIATTLAVLIHEVPQEMGDFGILLHAGFKKSKALLFNFLSALTAVLGALIALTVGPMLNGFTQVIIPFTAGGFIYIAGSDLIPELHKECRASKSAIQFLAILLGIGVMIALTFLE